MKTVLLIGDTIRLGYEPAVRAALADCAHVSGPAECGEHTTNLLFRLQAWVLARQPDVVQLNAGHWDTRRVVRGGDEPGNVVPLAAYRDNVARLIAAVRGHTRATVVWATTTPVLRENYERAQRRLPGGTGKHPDAIRDYNAAACAVARELGATINDLHACALAAGIERVLLPDGIHFTAEGYELLGAHTSAMLRPLLDP
jgi:lysophospholipase L1-like esterase